MNTSYKKSQDIKNRQYLKEQAGNMFDKGYKYSKDIKVGLQYNISISMDI